MKAFDDLIALTDKVLSSYEGKSFSYNEHFFPLLSDPNELILQKEQAYELGAGSYDSFSFMAVTQSEELVKKDEVVLYGPDISEIKNDTSYGRIVFLLVDDVESSGPDAFYEILKDIEISKYNLGVKGFMLRASALTNREQIRVSKEAVKNKLSFEQVGNLMINELHKNPHVIKAKIIFISLPEGPYNELDNIAEKSEKRSEAYNHMLKDSVMNCRHCEWKPVCAEIGEMKEFHKKMVGKK